MPKPSKSYPVDLVGERHYQAAIGDAAAGDAVALLTEPGNPYDDRAIVAVDGAGRTLGYLHRDSWLRGALIDEGRGAAAAIDTVGAGRDGFAQLRLQVSLTDDGPIGERDFVPAG